MGQAGILSQDENSQKRLLFPALYPPYIFGSGSSGLGLSDITSAQPVAQKKSQDFSRDLFIATLSFAELLLSW